MKAIPTAASLVALFLVPVSLSVAQEDNYLPGPDSKPQPGVPQGELITFGFSQSTVFPGTTRQVTVYVPRQYDPAKPACLYVDQDGVQWNAPTVLDNLIARKELPVIIGVFVTPGVVPAHDPSKQLSRFNRSLEYDGLGDSYYHLIQDEVLPVVETKVTADGRPVHLSHAANDRAIAGSSSGAIAAFTAAWEHPEAFSRVISSVGTYVGLRGGEIYPTLVRKYEPKPIRVFLQDGSHDLNIYAGDWWMANQTMERALTFAGYEVDHVWGDGSHNGKHIGAILPDALRFIWKDWPKAVVAGHSKNGALAALLIDAETWQDVPRGMQAGATRRGPDGRTYAIKRNRTTVQVAGGPETVWADGIAATDLVVGHNGIAYVTSVTGAVWRVAPDGTKGVADSGLRSASAVALSPDQSLLYVADGDSHWIYSYQVQADGSLADRQRYYWLHTDDLDDASHAQGMCCDTSGWLYVATGLGVQICDQAGRVNAILPTPGGGATAVHFEGDAMDTLIASCAGHAYARKLRTKGVNPWAEPVLPPVPHL